MSEELRSRLYNLYTAYGKGRFDFVLNFFDDDALFISYAPTNVFPYLGSRRGRAAIIETMEKIHGEFEHLSYLPIFMVAESGHAGVIVQVRLRQRNTKSDHSSFGGAFHSIPSGAYY